MLSYFDSHTAHAALARWSLGADETILDASYQRTASITLPLFRSPQTVSRDNWKDYLADTQCVYWSIIVFFELDKLHSDIITHTLRFLLKS